MPSTQVNIKIDAKLKCQAEKIAAQLGLNLSVVLRALLSEFVRRQRLDVGIHDEENDTPSDLTGEQLTKNLIEDGWDEKRAKSHGEAYDAMIRDKKAGKLIEL